MITKSFLFFISTPYTRQTITDFLVYQFTAIFEKWPQVEWLIKHLIPGFLNNQ